MTDQQKKKRSRQYVRFKIINFLRNTNFCFDTERLKTEGIITEEEARIIKAIDMRHFNDRQDLIRFLQQYDANCKVLGMEPKKVKILKNETIEVYDVI